MFRNQTSHRNSSPFHEFHNIINKQASHLVIHQNQSQQYAPLEKARTFSHKKLTITSAFSSPMPTDSNRKLATPAFEINKFYRPPVKGNCVLQSKRMNFEQSKVSLKVSSVNQVGSPQRRNENSIICNGREQKTVRNEGEREMQSLKKQLMEFICNKVQGLERQIGCQSEQIRWLKMKNDNQEKQLFRKEQVIKVLQEKLVKNSTQLSPVLIARIEDNEKVLGLLNEEVKSSQQSLNSKIDSLICRVVQMNILIKPQQQIKNQILTIQQDLNNEKKKINEWVVKKQAHVAEIERIVQILENAAKNKLSLVQNRVSYLNDQITAIEEAGQTKRDSFLRAIETKDSISYWETFDDYIPITTRSQIQIKNISLFAQDDYFFHPNHQTQTGNQAQLSQNREETIIETSNSLKQTGSFKDHSFETEKQRSALNNILSLMQHLKKKREGNLPLKCRIDNYNRILNLETKKVLQNQETLIYFKINELEKNILVNRGYLQIME